MSDDKLKSEDEKPSSRKSRQTTTRKTAAKKPSATTTVQKKKTPSIKKKTATSSSEAKKETTGTAQKTKAATTNSGKVASKDTSTDKTQASRKTVTKKSETKSTDTKADKKPTKKVAAENDNQARARKGNSVTKMATVAAVMFLGVLGVFLIGKDTTAPDQEELAKQATPEAPNPNASSPYGMRVEQLKEIENLLASLNFDPGSVDGDIDHEAVAAISLFQEISGLQVDGKPTPDLLVDLKEVNKLLNSN